VSGEFQRESDALTQKVACKPETVFQQVSGMSVLCLVMWLVEILMGVFVVS